MSPSRIPRADEQLVRKSDTVDGVAGRQAKDLAVRAVVAAYPAPNTAAAFDVYAGTTYSTSSAVVHEQQILIAVPRSRKTGDRGNVNCHIMDVRLLSGPLQSGCLLPGEGCQSSTRQQ